MTMVMAGKRCSALRPRKTFWVLGMLWVSLTTAGCDSPASQGASSSAPLPSFGEARVEKMKTNMSPEEMRALALPASETPGLGVDRAAAESGAVGSYGYETQLSPSKGLNTKRLFGTKAGSDNERFERLEAALQELRDDFDEASPSINRLMAIEQEIQTLVDQLQVLVEGDNAQANMSAIPPVSPEMLEDNPVPPVAGSETAANAPLSLSPPPPVGAAAPDAVSPPPPPPPSPSVTAPAVAADEVIKAIRIADHQSTTRVVLELTRDVPYTADIDPEQMLLLGFGEGGAAANLAAVKPSSALITSIDATPQSSGGVIIAMALSKQTKIVRQGKIPPDAQHPYTRVYIDLAR